MTQTSLSQTFDLILNILNFDLLQYWIIDDNPCNNNNSNSNNNNNLLISTRTMVCQYFNLSNDGKKMITNSTIFQKYSLWYEEIIKVRILFE